MLQYKVTKTSLKKWFIILGSIEDNSMLLKYEFAQNRLVIGQMLKVLYMSTSSWMFVPPKYSRTNGHVAPAHGDRLLGLRVKYRLSRVRRISVDLAGRNIIKYAET